MLDPSTIKRETGELHGLSKPRPTGSFARFFLWMMVVPALAYPMAFVLVSRPSYEHWATSQYGPMLEYAFESRPQNADVVIFGDSSAFLGIDPKIVHARLGIKAIVLPDTVGSIPVTGDRPLVHYLAHNPPPRLIVFYFSPWNLDFAHVATGRIFEGEEMMLRHESGGEIAAFALKHPLELPEFPFRLYSTFGPKMLSAALHHRDREQETADALGHADYTETFPPLTVSCSLPAAYLAAQGSATVEELMRKFSTAETRVMVYLAPIPGCRNSQAILSRSFASVGAAPPALLPPSSFAADPYYAHMVPSSVPVASAVFAEALRRRMQSDQNLR